MKENIKINRDFLRHFGYRTNKLFCGPRVVVVDLSRTCNFRCLGCWTHSPLLKIEKEKTGYLDTRLMMNLIDDLSYLGTDIITLSGAGDPSTHPDFYEICQKINEKGIFCDINSNLSLVDVKKLAHYKPRKVRVNFSAASSEIYQHFHQVKNEHLFEELLKKIVYLKNSGVYIRLVCVLCKDNIHQFLDMIRVAISLRGRSGYLEIKFNPVDVGNGTESVSVSQEQIKNLLNQIPEARRLANSSGLEHNLTSLEKYYTQGPSKFHIEDLDCYIGWFGSLVKENGDVHACCNKMLSLGNLEKSSFREIWSGKMFKEFRRMLKTRNQEKYPLLKKCRGCLQIDTNLAIHKSALKKTSTGKLLYFYVKNRKKLKVLGMRGKIKKND